MIDLLESPYDRRKELYPFIVQIGTGATGSYLVQHIAQMMRIFSTNGLYVVADPDLVEEKNLANQHFLPGEIGQSKAKVLARRYGAAYQVPIGYYDESYIESPEALLQLFNRDYRSVGNRYDALFLPIIVGCVDNHFSRSVMHHSFSRFKNGIYIDVGSDGANVPSDYPQRPKSEWTTEEYQAYRDSGWSGQCVTGVRLNNKVIQAPVADVFPDILEDTGEIRPSELTCSEIISSQPQKLIVNKFASLAVAAVINDILEDGIVNKHITHFHARKGYMRS
jgi:hypothetical protein